MTVSLVVGMLVQAFRIAAPPAPHVTQSADSIISACETAQRLAGRLLQLETRLERDVELTPGFATRGSPRRRGCRVSGHDDTDRIAAPVEALVEAMQAEGWRAPPEYQADGPDGTLVGLTLGSTLCLVRGSWDGGDDSDSTYVPVPGYDLEVACFRRTAGDERPR